MSANLKMITRMVREHGHGQTDKNTWVDLNSGNLKVMAHTHGPMGINTLVNFLPAYHMVTALTPGRAEEHTLANGSTIKWTGMELSHFPTEEYGQDNFGRAYGLVETNMPPAKHPQNSHDRRTVEPNHKRNNTTK
jgi:hypothetical protein